MIAFMNRHPKRNARIGHCVAALVVFAASAAFAQSPAVPASTTTSAPDATPSPRVEVPDGSPALPAEKVVSNASVSARGKSTASVIVEEERVQGRLSSAHVNVSGGWGRGYTVVDPNVGRTDRQADNGGKRVAASLWELLRF